MKRYRLVYRGSRNAFYCFDTETNKRESLGTGNAEEAQRLIDTKNEAVRHTGMNLQIAQVYLQHSDPTLSTRTWQNVMDAMSPLKTGPTQARWTAAIRDKAFDLIRGRKLIDTASEHFLQVLNAGTISTNMFLRRLHNFAVGMHYLPWPILGCALAVENRLPEPSSIEDALLPPLGLAWKDALSILRAFAQNSAQPIAATLTALERI